MATRATAAQERMDMQALVGSGFGTMPFSEYVLLDVEDGAKARAWLGKALEFVWFIDRLQPQKERDMSARKAEEQEAWSIAFTHRGLALLGIEEDADAPFPSEFRGGQADATRRTLLREDPAVPWRWGDVDSAQPPPAPVSILVMRVHDGDRPRRNRHLDTGVLAAHGLRLVRRVHGSPDSFRTTQTPTGPKTYIVEPFGFRDGMGQPRVKGLQGFRSRGGALDEEADVPLGEFVLGHANIYGERAHCPEVKVGAGADREHSFGRNGCYLAVQQILQDVDAFRKFEADTAPAAPGTAPTVVEKMVGRYKDGRPLQEVPQALAFDADFGFRTYDAHGLQCPIGSHIRRANPRDSLSDSAELRPKAAHLHRLLRRSRPFASSGAADDPVPPEAQDVAEVGLFFIAIVADLARQYEFVKRAWIGNPSFGNLCGQSDPLLGRSSGRRFTIPGQPTGRQVDALPDFTTTQGGGYFFLPGAETLRRIAAGDYTTKPQPAAGTS